MELLHYRNDDWVVLCQVCDFFADRISKMATTGQLSLPLDPMGISSTNQNTLLVLAISDLLQNNKSGIGPSKEHSNKAKYLICRVVSHKKVFE
jgi:hypothetical protein